MPTSMPLYGTEKEEFDNYLDNVIGKVNSSYYLSPTVYVDMERTWKIPLLEFCKHTGCFYNFSP